MNASNNQPAQTSPINTTSQKSSTETTAQSVIYRPMQWGDVDDMVKCFNRVWPQNPRIDGTPTAELIARYLTLHYIERCTWANVAITSEGTFAGVTLARITGQPVLFPQAHAALETTRALLLVDSCGATVLNMLENGFFVREGILEEDSDINESTQAELTLFMVNPDMRGYGVGRELWKQLLHEFSQAHVQAFFLHTDSSCDYGFYDHKGLTRVAERLYADHPEDANLAPGMNTDDQFIYRGNVNAQEVNA